MGGRRLKCVATILDVIENFFDARGNPDLRTLPGKVIWEFGEEVQRFARSYEPSALDETLFPVYLGGWPSANLWLADTSDTVLSSLLYSGQLLARDPISDWFSPQQYLVEHKMATSPGYINQQTGTPNITETRRFLQSVIPGLYRFRELIRSGVVVLAPAEPLYFEQRKHIEEVTKRLAGKIAPRVRDIVSRYTPRDLAVEHNVRGAFVWAGGNQLAQLESAIRSALLYFAREYEFSRHIGANYCAPLPFEQMVCTEGVSKVIVDRPAHRTIEGILATDLPIFSGLDPGVVAKIHNDDSFGEFRSQLHTVYSQMPTNESPEAVEAYLRDQEQAILSPHIAAARRSTERGPLSRLGIATRDDSVAFAAELLIEWATGVPGVGRFIDRALGGKQPTPARPIWTALANHRRRVERELRTVTEKERSLQLTATGDQPGRGKDIGTNARSESREYWGIPAKPGNYVLIAEARLLADHLRPEAEIQQITGFQRGVYRPCPCGSGNKLKFCCLGLPGVSG